MILSDGRRIVPASLTQLPLNSKLIKVHPDFRMIVLANRPGFPFLGNNLFAVLGNVFSMISYAFPRADLVLRSYWKVLLHRSNFSLSLPGHHVFFSSHLM